MTMLDKLKAFQNSTTSCFGDAFIGEVIEDFKNQATEIARLRAALEAASSSSPVWIAMATEIAQLRAALEVFADYDDWEQVSPQIFRVRFTIHPAEIARKALEEP